MDRVIIFDTTLRDGEQSPGATMNVEEKIDIAHQLERLGVDVIEAGFPISSIGDFEAVERIAREIRLSTVCGLARAIPADIDRANEALKDGNDPRIHVFLSSSDIHLKNQMRKSRSEVLDIAAAMVARAKSYLPNIEFSPMDATRTDRDYLVDMLTIAIQAGATTLNIPDTVGFTVPEEYGDLISFLIATVPGSQNVIYSTHCHDDLGMAVANSLAGVRHGVRQIECTINGIGERAGNCSLEEVVMALRTRKDHYGIDTRIDATQLLQTSRMVSNYTGIMVQPNKAVVGANAFAHESGIHQDGILKDRTTYEIMDPRSIGLRDSTLVLGKHSGRHAFKTRMDELGYHLTPEDLNRSFARFKDLADKKKGLSDLDLAMIVSDEIRSPTEIYRLDLVQVSTGDHLVPTATVRLIGPDGSILCDSATGTGPVDAVYKAVNRLIACENRLIEFSVQSVTAGIDAIGEVTIRIESDGKVFGGRGADTDIIVASTRAYVNALNKLLAAVDQPAALAHSGT
uniref:2-isopropylmalate synthase n=1 Tax=uncultured bacterium F25-01 TaxID=1191433 RepID=I3VIG7_9BACT|nr:2-isopropylmalate synthase [uncultured bacterium F25-01]